MMNNDYLEVISMKDNWAFFEVSYKLNMSYSFVVQAIKLELAFPYATIM